MAKVSFEGFDKIYDHLMRTSKLEAVKDVVKFNGAQLQSKAMRNAPVDTGTLKRSISLELEDKGLTAEVEAKTHYAAYVEYGTRYMDAKPYLGPAYREQKEIFKRHIDIIVGN